MNINLGINILPSSCYTRKEFLTPPTSSVGSTNECVEKSLLCLSWQLTAKDGRLAVASNIGSVKWKAQTTHIQVEIWGC